MENTPPVITWTKFSSSNAYSYEVHTHTLHELAQYLVDAGPYQRKGDCPWIKLARFGTTRSRKNSLRHDANVLAITGVEGDYDQEQVTPEQAVEMLERAGIRAIVYTSPSHTAEKPRWRVLAPLSKDYPPGARAALLARVNGALGGILSNESFTLSQSYYYGEVVGIAYKLYVTYNDPEEGTCVDELDELDEIAINKPAVRHKDDEEDRPDYSINMFEQAVKEKGRKLKTGDGRRELLKQYVASRSGKGLLRDELMMMVEGVVNRYFDDSDPPDQQNVLEIINHFAAEDAAEGRTSQPVDLSAFERIGMPAPEMHAPAVVQRSSEQAMPLYPPPFPGVMTEICDAAEQCSFKPQPGLNLLASVIGMAAAISGEYSTTTGGRFNLYGLGTLESGGGKDMPRQIAEAVAALGRCSVLGKPASGAGIEDSINDRANTLLSVDELAHTLKAINDPRAPSHLRAVSETILMLYTASRGVYNRRTLARAPSNMRMATMVANPCVSLLGFSTPETLGDAFTEQNMKDGLMGRMLYVPGNPGVTPRRPKSGLNIPKSVVDWAASLARPDAMAAVQVVKSTGSVIVQEAHGIPELMDRLTVDMEMKRANGGVLGPALYGRSMMKLERIAGLLAISEDPQCPVIRMPHVEWARAFVLASDSHLLAFANQHMHSGEVTKNAAKLKELIPKILAGDYKAQRLNEMDAIKGGMVTRSQLLRVSKMDKQTFDKAILHMHDLGELHGVDEKGRFLSVLSNLDLR